MRRAAFVLTLLVVAALSQPTYAQYQTRDRSILGLHLMVYLPSDHLIKAAGDVWIGPSVDYNFTFDENDRPTTTISLGWATSDTILARAKYAPLTITRLNYFGGQSNAWYVAGGLGIYFTNFKGWDTSTSTYESFNDKTFGFNIRVGKQFGEVWYAEARYDITGDTGLLSGYSTDFSGLTLSVGTRVLY